MHLSPLQSEQSGKFAQAAHLPARCSSTIITARFTAPTPASIRSSRWPSSCRDARRCGGVRRDRGGASRAADRPRQRHELVGTIDRRRDRCRFQQVSEPHRRTRSRARARPRIEPGVVLDQLNAAAAPHGLQFGPDVATSNRANLGGMIGNNSAGSRSIRHGKTVDHVIELSVLAADATPATLRPLTPDQLQAEQSRRRSLGRSLSRGRENCGRASMRRSSPAFRRSCGA